MSASDLSLHSNEPVSETLQQLKLRLHAVREDCERYATLERQANVAFADHRRDLTQLRQKEHALHTEAGAALQSAVDATRLEVERLREEAAAARRAREAALFAELQAVRAAREERAAAMEHELDHLSAGWRRHQQQVSEAERVRAAASRDLAAELDAQVALQEDLREVKRRVQAQEEAAAAAAGLSSSSSSAASGGCCCCGGSPARHRRRRPCETVVRRFLPNGPVDRAQPHAPASQHVQAMMSTVQRRNYYRPREYLQRHGADVDYRQSPLRAQRKAWEAAEAAREGRRPPRDHHHYCHGHSPARDPPLLVDQPHGTAAAALGSSSSSSPRRGGGINAALRLLLVELAGLQEQYYASKAELTDPRGGDALEVSKDMRRTLAAMDRKAEQVRVLRRQQQQQQEARGGGAAGATGEPPVLLHEVLADIVAENQFCAAVYEDLLQLLRAR